MQSVCFKYYQKRARKSFRPGVSRQMHCDPLFLPYWTQNICEPGLHNIKRGREDGRARGEQDTSCAIASPPTPYHGWLAINLCICNGHEARRYLVTSVRRNSPPAFPRFNIHNQLHTFLTLYNLCRWFFVVNYLVGKQ